MAWKIYTALIFCLMILVSSTMTQTDHAEGQESLTKYEALMEKINQEISGLYKDINAGKTGQSTYEQSLVLLIDIASFIGVTNETLQSISESEDTYSLQFLLEDAVLFGFSDDIREKLRSLGYTDSDIEKIKDITLAYNDYYHRISERGFSSEEIIKMHEMGLSDSDIEIIHQQIQQHYSSEMNFKQMLERSKTEILQMQITVSLLSLKILESLSKDKEKDKAQKIKHLREKEEDILTEIENLSSGNRHVALEHIKEKGKEIYKLTEELIKHGATVEEFGVDYFVGLQLNLAAETALNGDEEFGIKEIMTFRSVLEQLSGRPVNAYFGGSNDTVINSKQIVISSETQTQEQQVGQVEESNEDNNIAEKIQPVLMKEIDIEIDPSLLIIISCITVNITEISMAGILTTLIAALPYIAAAILILLAVYIIASIVYPGYLIIFTAGGWPNEIIDRYGNKIQITNDIKHHVSYEANNPLNDPCKNSSHQAILDNKWMIKVIVKSATQIFYRTFSSGQIELIYYYFDGAREWVLFARQYGNKFIARSSYRVDCPQQGKCLNGKPYNNIIEKWQNCEGFKELLKWPPSGKND